MCKREMESSADGLDRNYLTSSTLMSKSSFELAGIPGFALLP